MFINIHGVGIQYNITVIAITINFLNKMRTILINSLLSRKIDFLIDNNYHYHIDYFFSKLFISESPLIF